MLHSIRLLTNAFSTADGFGKFIFLLLFALSCVSFTVIIYQAYLLYKKREETFFFKNHFRSKTLESLFGQPKDIGPLLMCHYSPLSRLLVLIRKEFCLMIDKNRTLFKTQETFLTVADIASLSQKTERAIRKQNPISQTIMFFLHTSVTLAPLLGILGTVWGIFMALFNIGEHGGLGLDPGSAMAGISTALATTVIGLLIAICNLSLFAVFKRTIHTLHQDEESIAHEFLSMIELHYRTSHTS